MLAVSYTDTDQIRSVLGLDVKDMSDDAIVARATDKELRLDLTRWLPTHTDLYVAGTTGTPTDSQVAISDAIQLYSTYFCASLIVPSTQLGAAQSISDGKNSMARFATNDWNTLLTSLRERQAYYKDLIQELASSVSGSSSPTMLFGVGLAVDPVISG